MSKLLKKAASPEVLNAAWKRLRNDRAVWTKGISKKEMENNFAYHLLKLSDELKKGNYRPDPVRFFPVSKGNGKKRIISASTLRDKVAQRAVLTVIEPFGERRFHHDSFGYRPGRTIDMALSRVREYVLCGMGWVVDADIQSYFDNIPHKPLIKVLNSFINDKKIMALIKRWLEAGIIRRGFLSAAKGIPQGAVISPFMCNAYLTSWDDDMAGRNLPFVRYADDFLVFAKTEGDALKAHKFAGKSLKKLGLMLNPDKTRVTNCSHNVRFLGRKLPSIKKTLTSL